MYADVIYIILQHIRFFYQDKYFQVYSSSPQLETTKVDQSNCSNEVQPCGGNRQQHVSTELSQMLAFTGILVEEISILKSNSNELNKEYTKEN